MQVKGFLVVILSKDGRVQAAVPDFEGKISGFTRERSQEIRAERAAWTDVMRQHCSDAVAKAVCANEFNLQSVANKLTSHQGWKVVGRAVEVEIGE